MDDALECDLYIPRRELTREWVTDLCHQMWQHGAEFSSPQRIVGTWDEQLGERKPYPKPTLAQQIDDLVEDGFGSLPFWDRRVELTIDIDPMFKEMPHLYGEPDSQLESLALGVVTLSTRLYGYKSYLLSPDLSPLVPHGSYLLSPRHQVYLAMAHWAAVVIAALRPIFGVGYYFPNELAIGGNDFFHTHHQRMGQALAEGRWPPIEQMIARTALQYASPQFVTPDLLRSWASQDEQSVRVLPGGGVLACRLPEPYDIAMAKEFSGRGHERHLASSDRLTYLRRARAIVESYGGRIPPGPWTLTSRIFSRAWSGR